MLKNVIRLLAVIAGCGAVESFAQTFQTLHSFPADGSEGTKPFATLTIGPDRQIYGTTTEGGAGNAGTAFKVSTDNVFNNLGSFDTPTTGKSSRAQLVNAPDGFLYGATSEGTGTAGDPLGTVFKLNPAGGVNAITQVFALPGSGISPKRPMSLVMGETNVLHVLGSSPGGLWRVPLAGGSPTNVFNFTTSDQGSFPWRIMRGSDGNLFGVTTGTSFVGTDPGYRGTVFRIAPNGGGFTTLHDCLSATGVAPTAQLVEGPDGVLYGAMSSGGTFLNGVIFKITKEGAYTVLCHTDDNLPNGDLLLASDGKLYGTCSNGGNQLYGSIYRLNTNGTGYQLIHQFNKTNGAYPKGGLIQADDGNLYGVTSEGGTGNTGTIFRIDLNLPTPAVNRPPVAVNDIVNSLGSAVGVNILLNDFDPDEDPDTAEVEEPLAVTIETGPAHGTYTLDSDGTLTYFPTAGQYQGYDEIKYRITDPDGLSAVAYMIITNEPLPPIFQEGVYNGILNLDPTLVGNQDTPRGQLVLNVSALGVFTGKLFTDGKRVPVRGIIDDGVAIGFLKYPRGKTSILFLSPGQGGLSAIFFGQETWSGALAPLPVNLPAKSNVTVALPKNRSDVGSGFAIGRILSNGLVGIVGKMGDGTKLAWGTTLVSIGSDIAVPVYGRPIRGGVCAGWLQSTGTFPPFQGSLRWIRPSASKSTLPYPDGFAGSVPAVMDYYVPPARGVLPVNFGGDNAGSVEIAGVPMGLHLTGTIQVDGTRFTLGDPLRSFSINRANGLFSGKMKSNGRTYSFRGVVLQSINGGLGSYSFEKAFGEAVFVAE